MGRGPSGDLYLIIALEPHPKFRVDGRDLYTTLPAAPWEAALGANLIMHVFNNDLSVTVPPNTSSGQKLRLRGKGLPNPHGQAGDLYAEVRIVMPKAFTKRQREAWEILRESNFNPRTE
jgi:curved DNA-binding protein